MSSMKRKYVRAIIRHQCYKRDGNIKGFAAEWREYQGARAEQANDDGTSTAVRIKPKRRRMADRAKAVKQLLAPTKKKDMTAVKI